LPCRRLELFSEVSAAIDGSKFKAGNTRDRNFIQAKIQRRPTQIDESIAPVSRQGEAPRGRAASPSQMGR
jgi:transposase